MHPIQHRFPRAAAAFAALYFLVAGAAGAAFWVHEQECSAMIDAIAARQDLNHVTNMDVNLKPKQMGVFASFLLKLTSRKISNHNKAVANEQEIDALVDHLKPEVIASLDAGAALLAFTALFLAGGGLRPPADPASPTLRIYQLLAASLVFFVLGIGCPVLTATVRGQHMLIGSFIIETSSKGIVSTVVTLFRSGNWIIGCLLAGFSIGIPIFKGVAVLCTLLRSSPGERARVGRLLEAVGKWSLTDVLVAAVLLGVFSLNAIHSKDGGIVAVPRFALGFFILYCVLAARTSYLLRRAGHQTLPPPPGLRRLAGIAALLAVALAAGSVGGYYGFALLDRNQDAAILRLVRPSGT
ncbi:MAG TPA: paraquat-inducible protein A [Opitutaceae bacterium]|jgi:paraquat-inducible protein A|nr:paraquat-inducible protein A [Opitutaceae bacterium]